MRGAGVRTGLCAVLAAAYLGACATAGPSVGVTDGEAAHRRAVDRALMGAGVADPPAWERPGRKPGADEPDGALWKNPFSIAAIAAGVVLGLVTFHRAASMKPTFWEQEGIYSMAGVSAGLLVTGLVIEIWPRKNAAPQAPPNP